MLQIYDTPSRSKREFEPLEPGRVRLYSCGPTVWDHAHIGNFRSFLFFDVLKRYLRYRGYTVEHVMNLTDVDDRIVRQVNDGGTSLEDYVSSYIDGFFGDLEILGIEPADHYPRATRHIAEMVDLVQRLLDRGVAYERDGSVYFAIARFPAYGEFAHLDVSGMRDGARIDIDKYDKDDVRDFVLWKAWTEADGAVAWEAPWGRGRPGWHLECSCMSMKYLGETFDLHTGGVDLVFPHHQNEIAQSEGATGKPFARYWMHSEFLNIDGAGMSKSVGNTVRIRDLLEQGPEAALGFRYFVVTNHYRTTLNFTPDGLQAAIRTRVRLGRLYARLLEDGDGAEASPTWSAAVDEARQGFVAAMDDDLNAPKAMASVFQLVGAAERAVSAADLGEGDARQVRTFLDEVDAVLGVVDKAGGEAAVDPELPEPLTRLLEARQQARQARDWARSDALRDELAQAGVVVMDTPEGATWTWAEGKSNSLSDND